MRVPELELELEFEFNATAKLELELVNSSVALLNYNRGLYRKAGNADRPLEARTAQC